MSIKHKFLNFIYKNKVLISSIYFNICFSRLPIKKNKIVFSNYYGCGYGCNPKYIAEEIIKQKLPVEIVWITKPEFIEKKEFPSQIKLVNFYDTNKCLFELATAKVWIDNMHKIGHINKGLIKKKNQFYLNTWHGSLGIKRIEGDVERLNSDKIWKKTAKKNSDMIDIMISNSDFETDIYKRAMWFENKIIKAGHPRNDIFFKNDTNLSKKIKDNIGITENKKIALYVPSYRDNLRTNCFDLDYSQLKQCLEYKTGKEWEILTKFHPKNLYKIEYLNNQSNIQHDVSFYPDIQELLYIADIIISDYSSCMFDFMLTKKPCFIYANDIQQYNNERGFYYKLEETPFPVAKNNQDLIKNIQQFDLQQYKTDCETFLNGKQAYEDGNASQRVVNIIREYIK